MNDEQLNCPDCGKPLRRGAKGCECGWTVNLSAAMHEAERAAREAEQREREAARERARASRYESAGSPSQEKSMALIHEIGARAKASPIEHWKRVLANPSVPFATKEAAREALARLEPQAPEREPGCDDEEAAHA